MTTRPDPYCHQCQHFNIYSEQSCKAYPDGIPDSIFVYGYAHNKPRRGQKGTFVFTPKENSI